LLKTTGSDVYPGSSFRPYPSERDGMCAPGTIILDADSFSNTPSRVLSALAALILKSMPMQSLFTAAGCSSAVQAPVDAFGGLDVLVNNASTAVSGNVETLDDNGLMERLTGKTLAYMRCRRNRALSTAACAIGTIADSGNGDTLLALISQST
jgi:hypothetical protein